MPYVYDKDLMSDAGGALGTFSSHWAACAAMIRLSQPDFKSTGGDKPEDLAEEARILRAERDALLDEAAENRAWERTI